MESFLQRFTKKKDVLKHKFMRVPCLKLTQLKHMKSRWPKNENPIAHKLVKILIHASKSGM